MAPSDRAGANFRHMGFPFSVPWDPPGDSPQARLLWEASMSSRFQEFTFCKAVFFPSLYTFPATSSSYIYIEFCVCSFSRLMPHLGIKGRDGVPVSSFMREVFACLATVPGFLGDGRPPQSAQVTPSLSFHGAKAPSESLVRSASSFCVYLIIVILL